MDPKLAQEACRATNHHSTRSPERNSGKGAEHLSIFQQLRAFRSQIPKEILEEWETPASLRSLLLLLQDWGTILVGYWVFENSSGIFGKALGLHLMAWGQRAVSNLAHDSIHGNLIRGKIWNDLLANALLAPLSMTTAAIQRRDHSAHHNYLGTERDPDHGQNSTSLKHYRTRNFTHTSLLPLFMYDLIDVKSFLANATGSLLSTPVFLIIWWIVASILLTPRFTIFFHLARCTIGYAAYTLREVIDHSGLPTTSIMSFTRTSPANHPMQMFLYAHDDNFHILHHLLPRVPMVRLQKAHSWLMGNHKGYRETYKYKSYLLGDQALFADTIHKSGAGKL